MNKIIIYMLHFILIYSVNGYTLFDDVKKKSVSNIEDFIYQDTMLSKLDNSLNIIYNKAIEFYANDSQVKFKQIIWLRDREQVVLSQEHELIDKLIIMYESRILELLRDKRLRDFFLKNFINDPFNSDLNVFILAIIALREFTFGAEDWYNSIEDLFINPMIMPIARQTMIIAMMTTRSVYREEYIFFKIYYTKKEIKLEPYYLPQPKMFRLFNEGSRNSLVGNFAVVRQNNEYLLSYNERISSYVGGNTCVWLIGENDVKIIKEILYNSDDFVKKYE